MARRLTPTQQKQKVLGELAKTDSISAACTSAKITRSQYREMVASGYITEQELTDSKDDYIDRVLGIANKAALDGIPTPVVRYGKVVKREDGTEVTEMKTDVASLRFLMQRLEAQQGIHTEETIRDAIPDMYRIRIDARLLLPDELVKIKKIAQAIEDRTQENRTAKRLLSSVDIP